MFRVVAEQETELGRKIKGILSRGELVPDEIVMDVVGARLKQLDCERGFVLDGFPRTDHQAKVLTEILKGMGCGIDYVIDLKLPLNEILVRLTGRRICSRCGEAFHICFSPPQKDGICDVCGGELVQRNDDREKTIRNRFAVYHDQSERLGEYYGKSNRYIKIDGSQNIDSVAEAIRTAVGGDHR
jgi:adenylate kinase